MPTVNLFNSISIVRFLSKEVQMRRITVPILVLVIMVAGLGVVRPASAITPTCTTIPYHFITFDNGMNGIWNVEDFTSLVTICQTGAKAYQMTFKDNGTFVTLAAKSPGGNGSTTVAAGVKGVIEGGEVVNIKGVLKSPLPSSVGPIDFRGNTTQYKYFLPFFSSIASVSYVSWGWKYSTCGNGAWTDNAATETLYGSVGPNSAMGDITGSPAACQNPQWFDPADGRVEPRPGDRIAVYCIDADKIVVYGIADDVPGPRNGFLLSVFSYKAIKSAGDKGVTLSSGENGSVSASLMKGWFWIAWNGGKYNATGQGDFKKNFEAKAWCPLLGK